MEKIPTIFKRNPEKMAEVLQEPNPVCGWVFSGEGVATRKYDGTCCMIKNGLLYKRREVKPGKKPPTNFILAQHDGNTGKSFGWVKVDLEAKENTWHAEAFNKSAQWKDGTYELIGEKVQGNPESVTGHVLIAHEDAEIYSDIERTFDGMREFLKDKSIEGIVFHHKDGRMAKIKKRDFNY